MQSDQLNSLMDSYSSIISPEDYNHIITFEHLYIRAADNFIEKIIRDLAAEKTKEVVEIGCGPARVLQNIAKIPNINLTGVDADSVFLEYAARIIDNPSVNFRCEKIENFIHDKKVDIFYSQGFHHHVEKGEPTRNYLASIYNQLNSGGVYILSDEFIPNYGSENERSVKLVIWYAHIINNAMINNYNFLAVEEAKTLLDDLQEGDVNIGYKNDDQIHFTLSKVAEIDNAARECKLELAEQYAQEYLYQITKMFNTQQSNNLNMDLSRKDYKICDLVLRKEVEEVGFNIQATKTYGPIDNIGAMVVYILQKN